MSTETTIILTAISGTYCIILTTSLINYLLRVCKKQKEAKLINPLVKKCAIISLLGYIIFVLMSFILDVISSLDYIPTITLKYTKILCQVQTFLLMRLKHSYYTFTAALLLMRLKCSPPTFATAQVLS